jgi:tetratricopeptide (TPR) repeat protein
MPQTIYIKDYDTEVSIPDGADMSQVQAALKKQFPSKTVASETAKQPPTQPQGSLLNRAASAVAPYARPALEMGGMLAGGVAGAGLGAVAGGVGAIPGSVAGAGLGYASGRQVANLLEQGAGTRKNKGLPTELLEAGKDVGMGAAMEAGGAVLGLPVQKGLQALGKAAPRLYESVAKIPPRSVPKATREQAVKTALENKIPATQKGYQKLRGMIEDTNTQIAKVIDDAIKQPKQIAVFEDTISDYNQFKKVIDEIIPENFNGSLGIRVLSKEERNLAKLKKSNVWERNYKTDKKLPGTSVIGISKNWNKMNELEKIESVKKALDMLPTYKDLGPEIALVKGTSVKPGSDRGELIFKNAKVVKKWITKKQKEFENVLYKAGFNKDLESMGALEDKTIKIFDVLKRLEDVKTWAKKSYPDPTPINKMIDKYKAAIVKTRGGEISIAEAQRLKQGIYRRLTDAAYGEYTAPTKEMDKAFARGIKEELVAKYPILQKLNAKDSALIRLQNILERTVNRTRNWDVAGLSDIAGSGVGAAAGMLESGGDFKKGGMGAATGFALARGLRSPAVMSQLAFALNKASRIGTPKITPRAISYAAGKLSGAPDIPAEEIVGNVLNKITPSAAAETKITEKKKTEPLSAAKRGIEAYTNNDWNAAIREWQKALKEEPKNARQIISWINTAKIEKKKFNEFTNKKKTIGINKMAQLPVFQQ